MQRIGRTLCAVAMSASLLSGCFGGRMPQLPSNDHLPVAHPRDVAAKVTALVGQIEKGVSGGRSPSGPKEDVNPVPCGHEALRREVKDTDPRAANPHMSPWYVDYSPYSIGLGSSVEIPLTRDMGAVFPELRDYLQKGGWRIARYEQRGPTYWELAAESSDKGYGGIVAGPVVGSRRVTVTFSSPCFRHPDEIPKQ